MIDEKFTDRFKVQAAIWLPETPRRIIRDDQNSPQGHAGAMSPAESNRCRLGLPANDRLHSEMANQRRRDG